jgi:hypothetical protein
MIVVRPRYDETDSTLHTIDLTSPMFIGSPKLSHSHNGQFLKDRLDCHSILERLINIMGRLMKLEL